MTLKTYWNNQQLKSIGLAKDSIEEGVWKFYHPDGRLMMEGKYLHGKKVGLWKAWYESGQLSQEYYADNGSFKSWYRDSWFSSKYLEG